MSRKANTAIAEERRTKVTALLLARAPYREIARKLDVSLGTVAKDVSIIFNRWAAQQAPEERHRWLSLELAKLDQMEMGLGKARGGDVGQVQAVLRVMERRARLLGLDAPKEHVVRFEDVINALDPETRQQLGEDLADLISERGE